MIDVFGKALRGYLNGGSPSYVIRREDGNYCHVGISEYFTDYQEWSACEKELILSYARGRVLDVGAGAGRHSLFLKNRNLEVHSLDNSSFAVDLMRIRGLNNVYLMDLREMNFPANHFDSVLMISNDLGLAGTIEDTKKLLRDLFMVTKPSGKIIATIRNPNKYVANNEESFVYNHRENNQADAVNTIKLRLEYDDLAGDWFYSLLISPKDLEDLVKDTGWFVAHIIEKDGCNFYGTVLKKEASITSES